MFSEIKDTYGKPHLCNLLHLVQTEQEKEGFRLVFVGGETFLVKEETYMTLRGVLLGKQND